jgi:hypothetical protein
MKMWPEFAFRSLVCHLLFALFFLYLDIFFLAATPTWERRGWLPRNEAKASVACLNEAKGQQPSPGRIQDSPLRTIPPHEGQL